LQEIGYEDKNGDTRYCSIPWSVSFGGLLYNATLFEKLGLSIPKTTDEMFALMETVKDLGGTNPNYKDKTYTMISSKVTLSSINLYLIGW
jgi:ABC-type glycerol-3-phosphate transport system substrate-binding protein